MIGFSLKKTKNINDKNNNECVTIDTAQAHLALYADSDQTDLGPMVDDGAPYSAIGLTELTLVHPSCADSLDYFISPLPESIAHFRYW